MSERRGSAGRLLAELGVIVLGVLIAFWVENYREYRGERQEERVLLEALREEFAENRDRLDWQMAEYERRRDAQTKLMELGGSAADLSVDSASVLWAYALRGGTLDVADGVLNSALGAGGLSLIEDADLRQMIARWPSQVSNFRDIDLLYRGFRQETFYPYLASRIEAPPFGGYGVLERGYRADGDYSAVLGTPEFGRLLSWAAGHHQIYESVASRLYELLDDIEARLAEVLEE